MAFQSKEKMFTTEDAAKFLHLQPDTVRKHVQRGNLSPQMEIGNSYIFAESELSRFKLEKRERGNPAFQRRKTG